jgi:peptide deformylase
MAIRKIARMGHPVLRQVAAPVPRDLIKSPRFRTLVQDLRDTMEDADGAGLAAPQIHEPWRVVILTLDEETGPRVWFNPRLSPRTEELKTTWEGCLSVPGMRGQVSRPVEVEVEAIDERGRDVHLLLKGFAAVVAQHECDHLDGVLYVDRALPRTLSFLEEYRRYALRPSEGAEGEEDGGEAEEES